MARLAIDARQRTGLLAALMAVAMIGLGYAAVPLYRAFCQVTGFGGTTQRVDAATAAAVRPVNKKISVRFDSNVAPDLPWKFAPEKPRMDVTIGARNLAIFTARNLSDKPIKGMATFNVTPEQAGGYFNKIQCFCFNEQILQPGEEVRMPVIFYVDPKLLDDADAKDIEEITLSYTFHKAVDN